MKLNLFSKIFSKFALKLDFGRITSDTLLGVWNKFNNNNERELRDEPQPVVGGYGFTQQAPGVTVSIEDEICTGVNQINFTVVASDKGQAAPYSDVISQVEQARDEDVTQLAILSRVPVLDHIRASERNPVYRAILTLVGESPDSLDPLMFMLGFFFAQWQTLQKLDTMGLRRIGRVDGEFELAHATDTFRRMMQRDHVNCFPVVQTCMKHQHEIMTSFIEMAGAENYIFQDNEHYYYISWIRYELTPFLISRPETANALRDVRAVGNYILTNVTGTPLGDLEHLFGMILSLSTHYPISGFDALHLEAARPPRVVPLIQAAGDLEHGANRHWDFGHVDMMYGRIRDFMMRHKKLDEFELVVNMGQLSTQKLLAKTHEETRIVPTYRVQLRRLCFVAPAVASKYTNHGMGVDAQSLLQTDNVKLFVTAPTAFAKIVEAAENEYHVEHDNANAERVMWRAVISNAAASARLQLYGPDQAVDDVWECAGTTDFKYAYNLAARRYDTRLGPKAVRNNEANLPRVKGWTGFWNSNICIYPSGLARNVNYHVLDMYTHTVEENVGIWQRYGVEEIARIVREHNEGLRNMEAGPPLDMDGLEDVDERPDVRVNGVQRLYGPDGIEWTGNEDFADFYYRQDNIVEARVIGTRRAPVSDWLDTYYIIDKTVHCRPSNENMLMPMSAQEYITVTGANGGYYTLLVDTPSAHLPVDNFLRFSGYGSRRADNGDQLVFRTKKNFVTGCVRDYHGEREYYNVRNDHETHWPDEPNYGGNRAFDHFIQNDDPRSLYIYRLTAARLSTVVDKMAAMAHSREEEFGPAPYDFDDDWDGNDNCSPEPSDFARVEDSQTHTTGDAVVNETAPQVEDGGDGAN